MSTERELQETRARGPRQEKKRKKRRGILLSILVILIIVPIATGVILMQILVPETSDTPNLTGETINITIPAGASTTAIADILEENGLIDNALIFRLQSRYWEFDGTYKQGTYDIDTGLDNIQLMQALQIGVVMEAMKITIPEGYTTQQMANRVEQLGIGTADEFIAETRKNDYDYAYLEAGANRDYPLEGYLFPSTYHITEDTTVRGLIELMLKTFNQIYEAELKPAMEAQGNVYTLDEYVIMASIIEKEIAIDTERPIASSVIHNRLDIGMPLQMDATVLYAMGIVKENVTYADLETESLYNTYQVDGLPIGPISSPGKASLVAAITPDDTNYYYYVVEAQGKMNHVYAENYDDFLKAKANYKASQN